MPKNIILCCDGTCNQFGTINTNVMRLFQSIVRSDPAQVGFYDPGVGTFAARFFGFYLGNFFGKLLGAAFGYGIKKNMEDCYRFLMDTYEEGDRVYIFGFSRGAFTARSLASMLDQCGLLYKHHQNLIPYMSRQYFGSKSEHEGQLFKATFCRECVPHFVGVWDTVGSLGWILASRKFANNKLNPKVKYAYHALSIDEKRKKFAPTLWDEAALAPTQKIEQVWFAGVHCDVGGGYADHSLANIPFLWMVEQAKEAKVLFIKDELEKVHGNPLGKMHNSYKGWWRLLRKQPRSIPHDAKINQSVWERKKRDKTYRPQNLP